MKKTLLFILCSICLSACSKMFEEKEQPHGFVKADCEPFPTNEVNVRYFDFYSGLSDMESADVFNGNNFLSRVEVGSYKALAYTLCPGNTIQDHTDLNLVTIVADTCYSKKWGGYVIKSIQQPVYISIEKADVQTEDTTRLHFPMLPITKKLRCNVSVKGMSTLLKVDQLTGYITGVTIGKKMFTNQPITKTAWQELAFFPKEENNAFTSSVNVFGLASSSNILKLNCIGEDLTKSTEIDLSSVLTKVTKDDITIDVVIEIGEDMEITNIFISDWQETDQGQIIF